MGKSGEWQIGKDSVSKMLVQIAMTMSRTSKDPKAEEANRRPEDRRAKASQRRPPKTEYQLSKVLEAMQEKYKRI